VHSDLEDETVLEALNLKGVEDRGKVIGVELDLYVGRKSEDEYAELKKKSEAEEGEARKGGGGTYVDDGTNDLLDLTGLDLGGSGVGAGCIADSRTASVTACCERSECVFTRSEAE
jgi:hypothetical protein